MKLLMLLCFSLSLTCCQLTCGLDVHQHDNGPDAGAP